MDRNPTINKWENDAGWLKTPSGTKIGKVGEGVIELWDKKTKSGIPMTLNDFVAITGESTNKIQGQPKT